MIDVLGADVIIAGTQTDAQRRHGDARERLAALEPIARYAVLRKWTDDEMESVIRKAPAFARVAGAFRELGLEVEEEQHHEDGWGFSGVVLRKRATTVATGKVEWKTGHDA